MRVGEIIVRESMKIIVGSLELHGKIAKEGPMKNIRGQV